MASGTMSGTVYSYTARSTGIQLGSNEYPKGTVTLEPLSDAYWYLNAGVSTTRYFDCYICDGNGNYTTSFGRLSIKENNSSTDTISGSVDVTSLKGTALYFKTVGGYHNQYLQMRGTFRITVTTAQYSFSITVSAGTGGSCSVSPSGSATPGTTVTLSPSANTGYHFSSYTKSPSSLSISNNKFTMPSQAVSITANFAKTSYSISKATSPSGAGTVTVASSATMGDSVSVSQTPSTGYKFSSWSTSPALTISGNKFTMPAGNVTITANYTKISYTITKSVNPAGSGTVSGPNSATYGDAVTLSQTPASGYLFSSWSSSDVTVSNNKFTMPAKNVSVVANYTVGRSTATLNKSSYATGDTATLTITPQSTSFTHRYKLSFGTGMETDWVSLAAGVTTASIYLPIAWSFRMGGTSVTGGTLTLETYSGSTLFGTYTITGLTLTAKDNIIPSFTVWRVDASGTAKQDGGYGRYTYTLPSGMTGVQITCGGSTASGPPSSGDILPGNRLELSPGESISVVLQFTYGSETIQISREAPGIRKVNKILHVEVT